MAQVGLCVTALPVLNFEMLDESHEEPFRATLTTATCTQETETQTACVAHSFTCADQGLRSAMPGYTKLFSSILQSTMWDEDVWTRVLWITMLALADRDGVVESSVPGLAHEARIPVDKTREGLKKLEAPDPDSRTPDNNGRRIERLIGGWKILNYEAYRHKHDADEVREKTRLRVQRYRERHPSCNVTVTPVTPSNKSNDIASPSPTPDTIPPTPLSKGGIVTLQNQELKNHPRKCMMPGCNNPARVVLPGAAQMYCSEVCLNHAKHLTPENFKGVKV